MNLSPIPIRSSVGSSLNDEISFTGGEIGEQVGENKLLVEGVENWLVCLGSDNFEAEIRLGYFYSEKRGEI